LDVKYTIVREDGASIYSCSPEAKKEFADLDPNIISAISLARRIQEPLAELIKVEPKHLGVGMYQHDIKKKYLDEALDDVVSECVSFVGVDLNTASQCLLRHVAGLTEAKAQQVIEHRTKNGPFVCRQQLLEVYRIGKKVFQQCAGFLRVGPTSVEEEAYFYKNPIATKLDCTNIHPESYGIAAELVKEMNLKLVDVGKSDFIKTVKEKQLDSSKLKEKFKVDEQTIQLILDALCKPLNHDLRSDCPSEPVFKKGLTTIYEIQVGSVLTGVVSNVTHFGCFVDIGVGMNGLIHVSKYNGFSMKLGDKVEVKVISIDIKAKRIGLQAVNVLS
jgi:transcriptional accessory protein Tex/SPT6